MSEEIKEEITPEAKEEQKQEIKKPTPTPPPPMLASSNGMIIGNTFEERFRVCKLYAASGMMPKGYDTPEKVFAGIQYAIELGFEDKPLSALRNIAIINGQPSIWGEMPLALVKSSPTFEFIDEFFEDKEGIRLPETCSPKDVWAAVCLVQRKGEKVRRFAYTQDDRTTLGVAAIWKQFEKIMMKRKARAIALKDTWPDVLMGIKIAEYDNHVYLDNQSDKSQVIVQTPKEQKAKKFSDKLRGEDSIDAEIVEEGSNE